MPPTSGQSERSGVPAAGAAVAGSGLLDVVGAARYLGVTVPFVRRLVLEKRVRYFKLGKFVRFRTADLDALVEAGRHEPVAPWVHIRSTQRRGTTKSVAQRPKRTQRAGASQSEQGRPSRR